MGCCSPSRPVRRLSSPDHEQQRRRQRGQQYLVIRRYSTTHESNDIKLSILLDILNDYAFKWKEIGIALGFTSNELQLIEAKPTLIAGAPNSCMTEMLSRWVQWTPETQHGKYVTLQDLVKALQSKAVGLAVVAEEIKSQTREKQNSPIITHSQQQNEASFCKQQSESTGMRLECKTPIPVSTSSINEDLKSDKPYNLTPPVPSASHVLEHYAFYLRSCFTIEGECVDKWPQIKARKYINLAVVGHSHSDYNWRDLEEFRRATLHGSIDDILQSKAPIEFKDLLKPNSIGGKQHKVKRILLQGAPGIGKSTISWEICRKWGNGELFQEYSLVVFIRFRDPWVQKVCSISDLFRFPSDPNMQCKIADHIALTQGKGLFLILEGFDEAPPSLRKTDSLFFELYKGSLLPNATVMVTTRPSASKDLQTYCKDNKLYRRIEVLGFGKKEINEYIESAFSASSSDAKEDFYTYLELYPHIRSIMYVPLNSAIVTHVYQSCKLSSTIVPKTMTQLYTALIKTLLLRYMMEIPEYEDSQINDFNDIPQPILEKFNKLCKLAYEGVTKEEVQIIFSGLSKDFDSLGLMQSIPELYIDKGASLSHSFLHLTVQEYLAAYHLSQLDEETQVMFLKENLKTRFEISKFLCGLNAQNESVVYRALGNSSYHTDSEVKEINWHETLTELYLLFENQNPYTIARVLGSQTRSYQPRKTENHYVVAKSHSETYIDFYVLGYCISVSDCGWEVHFPPGYDIFMFIKGMTAYQMKKSKPGTGVTKLTVNFYQSAITNQLATAMCMGLFPNLQSLVLFYDDYYSDEDVDTETLTEAMVNFSKTLPINALTSLSIHNSIKLSEEVYEVLGDILASSNQHIKNLEIVHSEYNKLHYIIIAHFSSLKVLDISYSRFLSSSDMASLAAALGLHTSLTKLDITNSLINNYCRDLKLLVKSIKGLQTLNLSNVVCEHHYVNQDKPFQRKCPLDVQALSSMLTTNKSLLHIYLKHSNLKSKDAVLLSEALEINSTLQLLDLENNSIRSEGAVALAKVLESTSALKWINLEYNYIGNEGAVALAKALETNLVLESLSLCFNQIGDEGAVAITKMLKVNSTLSDLNLQNNKIEDNSIIMLLDCIRSHNTTIKMLQLQNQKRSEICLGISPPDCDRIQLCLDFCERHPLVVGIALDFDSDSSSSS